MITGIRFSSLLYNTKYPDFKIMTRHVLKGLVNPLDFLSFITDDMNIEGFAVYSPQWREYLGKLDQDKVNNISPGNLVYIRAYSDKTHRVSDMWDLIKRMLDPNPFTRMTATECLDHAVFEDGYLQDIRKRMWGVYLSRDLPQEYKISPTYRPSLFYKITRRRTLSNKGKSIQDMDSITYALSLFPDIETRFFRLFSVIDSMVRNVPNTDFGAFTFCILTLAIYAEYGLFYRKPHTLSESWFESNLKNNLMVHESIVSMFLPNFTDDLRNSRIRISIMFRFLLVDLLQFNLWI